MFPGQQPLGMIGDLSLLPRQKRRRQHLVHHRPSHKGPHRRGGVGHVRLQIVQFGHHPLEPLAHVPRGEEGGGEGGQQLGGHLAFAGAVVQGQA